MPQGQAIIFFFQIKMRINGLAIHDSEVVLIMCSLLPKYIVVTFLSLKCL